MDTVLLVEETSFFYLCTKGCYKISYSNVIQKMRSALHHKNTLFDALNCFERPSVQLSHAHPIGFYSW